MRQFLVHHDFPLDEEENEERINRRNKDTVNKKGRVVSVFVFLVFFLKIILNMYNHSFEKYILLHNKFSNSSPRIKYFICHSGVFVAVYIIKRRDNMQIKIKKEIRNYIRNTANYWKT